MSGNIALRVLVPLALLVYASCADNDVGDPPFSCLRFEVESVQVSLHDGSIVGSVIFKYRDGTQTRYGGEGDGEWQDPFVLGKDEVIVEIASSSDTIRVGPDLQKYPHARFSSVALTNGGYYSRGNGANVWCIGGFQLVTNHRQSPWYGREGPKAVTISGSVEDPIVYLPANDGVQPIPFWDYFWEHPGAGATCDNTALLRTRDYWGPSRVNGLVSRHNEGRLSHALYHWPDGGYCQPRVLSTGSLDRRRMAGRQFKICPAFRYNDHCLFVKDGEENNYGNAYMEWLGRYPNSPNFLWEFEQEWPGGPWVIRSVRYPDMLLHVGGAHWDVRVIPQRSNREHSRWIIQKYADCNEAQCGFADSGTQWIIRPHDQNHHPHGMLHATAGINPGGWDAIMWGLDSGSVWHFEPTDAVTF